MKKKKQIIAKVHEPTEWVNSLVLVHKPSGDLRICIDPQTLNKAIIPENYPITSVDEIMSKLSNATIFSKLDASQAFWQVPLDTESAFKCTFNSPFGRYRFLRMPYGIKPASEVFQKLIRQHFEDIEGVTSYIDDFLIWGKDKNEHDTRLKQVLDRCRQINLKLNFSKCEFGVEKVMFTGHIFSKTGVEPDESKIQALKNFKTPENKKDVERFLGIITYVSKFIKNMSFETNNLRILLKKDIAWHWDYPQQETFNHLKNILTNKPILQFFDPKKPITLSVDASQNAIGGVLLQNNLPVYYISKALTDNQKNWAQIEKEMFAITYACLRFHQFIYAKQITVETDHKPLVSIVKKPLNSCPLRLQRMLIQIQPYTIKLIYKPGTQLPIADALSRAHDINKNTKDEILLNEKIESQILSIQSSVPIAQKQIQNIKNETNKDPDLLKIIDYIKNGWPPTKKLIPTLKPYFIIRNSLSFSDNLLLFNEKIIIPKSLQAEMLSKLHTSHLGREKTKYRARTIFYWPNMSQDIDDFISNCRSCVIFSKSPPKEPLIHHKIPERAWQKIAMDIFKMNGLFYICVVDYYSKFTDVKCLKNITSESVILYLKHLFSLLGTPQEIVSDNGGQLCSDSFKKFSQEWGFDCTYTSPYFPQANGQVERQIGTMKSILKKCFYEKTDPYLALLELHNTPLDNNLYSPAQLLLNRNLKSILPVTNKHLKPKIISSKFHRNNLKQKQKTSEFYYNRKTRKLPPLKLNQNVFIKNNGYFNLPGKIIKIKKNPRSYEIKLHGSGKIFTRNRHHLKADPMPPIESQKTEETENFNLKFDNRHGDLHAKQKTDDGFYRTKFGRIVRPVVRFQI